MRIPRKWGNISLDEPLDIQPHTFNLARECLGSAVLAVDFNNKKMSTNEPLDSDRMALEFSMQFADTPLTVGQLILFRFNKKLFQIEVKKLSSKWNCTHKHINYFVIIVITSIFHYLF
ncbi:unnamed protein product [Trichobilharzia regenti]|nr:unnamed protein product [Trichobilharzia regenti]